MPVYFVSILQKSGYNPSWFIDEVGKFPDLTKTKKIKSTRASQLFIIWGYYVWLAYIAVGLLTLQSSIIFGIVVLFLGPLAVATSLYLPVYTYRAIKALKPTADKDKAKH